MPAKSSLLASVAPIRSALRSPVHNCCHRYLYWPRWRHQLRHWRLRFHNPRPPSWRPCHASWVRQSTRSAMATWPMNSSKALRFALKQPLPRPINSGWVPHSTNERPGSSLTTELVATLLITTASFAVFRRLWLTSMGRPLAPLLPPRPPDRWSRRVTPAPTTAEAWSITSWSSSSFYCLTLLFPPSQARQLPVTWHKFYCHLNRTQSVDHRVGSWWTRGAGWGPVGGNARLWSGINTFHSHLRRKRPYNCSNRPYYSSLSLSFCSSNFC